MVFFSMDGSADRFFTPFAWDHAAGWTDDLHGETGNIGLSDESVAQTTTSSLRQFIAQTGVATNRLSMP